MGGFISLQLALRNPDKINSMFLCAPAKDFMREMLAGDAISKVPGDLIPIPENYLHSSGIGGIPKLGFK